MKTMVISSSRNPQGQTARAADAILKGVTAAGGYVERVYLPTLNIERCRQCDDDGWGDCRRVGQCVIDDHFDALVAQIREADTVVFATPVYFSDLSESLRAFTDRLRRTCRHEAGSISIKGKAAIGLCVAGGGDGGAPICCVSLEKVLTNCGFDVLDMMPARHQNLEAKLPRLRLVGQWLAAEPTS